MEIKKVTEKYNFYKEGFDYILDLGRIKKGEDTTTTLLFENVDKLTVNATCGCTVADRKDIDTKTVSYNIKYKNCDSQFSKILVCQNNKEKFKIKIKGTCH